MNIIAQEAVATSVFNVEKHTIHDDLSIVCDKVGANVPEFSNIYYLSMPKDNSKAKNDPPKKEECSPPASVNFLAPKIVTYPVSAKSLIETFKNTKVPNCPGLNGNTVYSMSSSLTVLKDTGFVSSIQTVVDSNIQIPS
jgi:hypothetical protein